MSENFREYLDCLRRLSRGERVCEGRLENCDIETLRKSGYNITRVSVNGMDIYEFNSKKKPDNSNGLCS